MPGHRLSVITGSVARWILFVSVCCLLPGGVGADERAIDRRQFASADQPAWVYLTDFEQDVLHRVSSAQSASASLSLSPDTLLALYLLASGDVREYTQFYAVQQRLEQFWRAYPHLRQIVDERQLGRDLLRAMHRFFFYPDESGFPQYRYAADQSALSGIFVDGVYNCISSALLYIVLAEQAGLRTAGVLMPSHAFVQLWLTDGSQVEVETTSADGFDVIRDAEFFQSAAQQWFNERALVVASLDDYEQRQILSSAQLGFENMWSQHVSESRMAYVDRLRLAELRGLLQSASIDAQHNRLIYYYRESDYLLRQGDTGLRNKLFERITPLLQSHQSPEIFDAAHFSDPETMLPLLLLQAERSQWLLNNGAAGQALDLAGRIIRDTPSRLRDADVIRTIAWQTYADYLHTQIGSRSLQNAWQAISPLQSQCIEALVCLQALEALYVAEGRQYWDEQSWRQVIRTYESYLALQTQSPNIAVFVSNIEAAFLNEAQQYWRDEERDEAVSALQVCVSRYPQAQRCIDQLEQMRRVLR